MKEGTIYYPRTYDYYRFSPTYEIKLLPLFEGSKDSELFLYFEGGVILSVEESSELIDQYFTTNIKESYLPTEEQEKYIQQYYR